MDPILDIIKKYDPDAQKIVQPIIYRWYALTEKENYKLYCEYIKLESEASGLLSITVTNMVNATVLQKGCEPSQIDNYVNYVINYVNQYP